MGQVTSAEVGPSVLAGALFVAMAGGDDVLLVFAEAFVPAIEARAIEARGNDAALMMLTAIGAAASGGFEQVG